jgi:hypothetical protein
MPALMLATVLTVAACHIGGQAPFLRPDNQCTPGDYDRLSVTQVCTSKTRPTLLAADRRRILARYGLTIWSGADGELDHRVPFFLGGRTDVANIWPERGSIPNTKDRLEFYVYRRVCADHTMRVRTARLIFLSDWTSAYDHYFPR